MTTSQRVGTPVRTAARLRDEGGEVAVLDLTAISQNLSREQWDDGVMRRLGCQMVY